MTFKNPFINQFLSSQPISSHQTAFYSLKQPLNHIDSTVGYHRMQKYFYAAFLQEMTRWRHLSRQEVKQTMDVDTSGCHCLRS